MESVYELKGKNVWITGGKRIGQRIAEVFAEHGANLIISYNNSKKEAVDTIKKVKRFGVKAILIKADVSSREDVLDAVKEIKKEFKKLDILILMASIFEKTGKIESITEEDFKRNFDVHILGTFFPIQAAMSIMPHGSHIITISDRTAVGKIYPGYLPYVMTKGAVAHLTRALALELGPKGIFINSIAPGPILKPKDMSDAEWLKIRKSSIINYQINDQETVEEFAKLVLYLSTTMSTGSVYPLDFGHL